MIIDTHTHVLSSDTDSYPIDPPVGLTRMPWIDQNPVDADGLVQAMDIAGVHGAVIVQAKGAYGFDNAYAAVARFAAPGRLVNASIVDVERPDAVEQLEYWTVEHQMLGTRLFDIPPSDPSWLTAPATATLLDACRKLGVRIALCILVEQLPLVRSLCEMADEQLVSLDHCGFSVLTGPTPELDALADVANLRLKVTTTMLEPVVHAGLDVCDAFERMCDVFGVDRLMWGSDYPQHFSEPYPEIVDLARHACSRLTSSEQARFLSGTALEIWPELTP